MSQDKTLLILYLYDSKSFKNENFLNEIKNSSFYLGVSVVDINNLSQDFKLIHKLKAPYDKELTGVYSRKDDDKQISISIFGNFYIYFEGKSKCYEATKENLLTIKKILKDLNV